MGEGRAARHERDVAVVIPTVGRPTLARAVVALLADDAVAEVVVVADRDHAAVRSSLAGLTGDARVRIVEGPGRGAGWARQRGVESSSAPILLFLDDDVLPTVGLASAHARHHLEPDRVVVGYMPVGDAYRRRSATARVYGNDYLAACDELERDPTRVLTDLWAGNVSMTRASAERVPLAAADADFRRREDQVFGLRCARAGLTGVFDRTLGAEHQFERSVAAFLTAARDQALEFDAMRARFPELAADDAGAVAPTGVAARLIGATARPRWGSVLRGAVRASTGVAHVVHAWRVEEQGVALLRALVQEQARAEVARAGH